MNVEESEKKDEKRQIIVRLNVEEKKNFYMKCLENNKSMQEVLSNYISNYINS